MQEVLTNTQGQSHRLGYSVHTVWAFQGQPTITEGRPEKGKASSSLQGGNNNYQFLKGQQTGVLRWSKNHG
jgi:hypothetical protein